MSAYEEAKAEFFNNPGLIAAADLAEAADKEIATKDAELARLREIETKYNRLKAVKDFDLDAWLDWDNERNESK